MHDEFTAEVILAFKNVPKHFSREVLMGGHLHDTIEFFFDVFRVFRGLKT